MTKQERVQKAWEIIRSRNGLGDDANAICLDDLDERVKAIDRGIEARTLGSSRTVANIDGRLETLTTAQREDLRERVEGLERMHPTVPEQPDREGQIQALVDAHVAKYGHIDYPGIKQLAFKQLTDMEQDEIKRGKRFPHIKPDGRTTGATFQPEDWVQIESMEMGKGMVALRYSEISDWDDNMIRWLARGDEEEASDEDQD